MRPTLHERYDLLELCKVSFLLGREKRKPFKERDHVFDDGVEICYFKIPNTIRPAAKSSAAQMCLEEREYYSVFLRHIETYGYLPWNRVIDPWSKRNVEASFSVCKSREVITDLRRYVRDSCLHCCLSC